MKTTNFIKSLKKGVVTLIILSFTIAPFSCSKKTAFENSTVIPAARGDAKVKKDNNDNYNIEINISYLAEPERLNPPKKTYVVWMVANNNYPQNIGQIVGTTKLHVKFETVSSSKPERIFITAEDDGSTQQPSNMKVLETSIL
jgi:cell division protein FtsL